MKKYQDQGNLETTMAEKRTRDAIEGLEQEVLEQHKRYSPETLSCYQGFYAPTACLAPETNYAGREQLVTW
jgi:hypothetical protein